MENLSYSRQSVDEGDIEAVAEVLRSDFLTQGPKTGEFEAALARLRQAGARCAGIVLNRAAPVDCQEIEAVACRSISATPPIVVGTDEPALYRTVAPETRTSRGQKVTL